MIRLCLANKSSLPTLIQQFLISFPVSSLFLSSCKKLNQFLFFSFSSAINVCSISIFNRGSYCCFSYQNAFYLTACHITILAMQNNFILNNKLGDL